MSTVKEICEGVSRSLLDSPLTDIHLSDIASHITEWQELAPYLDLSEVEEKDVVDMYPNRPKLQRREALRKWKESNGNKATYRRLICILCSQGRVSTAQKLKELLVQSRGTSQGDMQAQLVENFRQYLCDCYTNHSHPSCFQWPFSTYHNFVELDLFDVPIQSSHSVDNKPLQPLSIAHIFDAGNRTTERKVIFVEGIAGVGKSTLCWYIRKEWAAGSMFQDFKLLIYIPLSNNHLFSATNLADLVPHTSEEMREAVARAIADARGKGICFLLDACDEAKQFSRSSFLFQFITGKDGRSMLPFATLLLTSRPGISSDLMKCAAGHILVKGFKSLDEYVKRVFSDDSMKRAQLFEALELKPELHSLCHLPLHAVILVHIFDFLKEKLPTTRTGLFHPLVCNFLIRHIQTCTEHKLDRICDLSSDLPADIYQALCKVSKLAYQSLVSGEVVITQSILRQAKVEPVLHDTFGFLQSYQHVTMFGPTDLYRFSHLSLQEFLAALHITQLNEPDQFSAFEVVYKQNPVSPILTFYAGLTKLVSERACTFLLQVLKQQLDLSNVVQVLQQTFDPACDIRRQLLALMNCLYETKKTSLISRITLTPRQLLQDKIILSSASCSKKNLTHVELPLTFMVLYPTDCLSIAYFVRLACAQMQDSEVLLLNLSYSPIKTPEIRALSLELCKPAQKPNVYLNISDIRLTNEALYSIKTFFNSNSAIGGLIITGCMIDDMQLALKYITEGVVSYRLCHYLSITDLNVSSPVLHHLILLLVSGRCLTTVDLAGSANVFKNPKAMPLFCAALRHTKLRRLLLDGCGIDDQALTYLAAVLTGGCLLGALDIGWNPYTAEGLTEFLRILRWRCIYSGLTVLSTNTVLNDEHRSLVEEFSAGRKLFLPFMDDLVIGCKDIMCSRDEQRSKKIFLMAMPEFAVRTPHHKHNIK